MNKLGAASAAAALVVLAAALAAAPAAEAATWYLPGASETPGQNGAYYSSTLWVTNTGSSPASVEFRYIPFAGTEAASPVVRTLQARETREYAMVLPTLLSLQKGAGTIVLVSDAAIVATMSTANTADPKGTFGLAVRAVPESELAGAGARHEVVYASHKADLKTASRTNAAAVLVDPNTSFTVVVFDPAGTELGRKTISSATPLHWQESVGPIVGNKDVAIGRLSFEVTSGRIAVYDSVVDNVTNDGFVIQGVPGSGAKSLWLLAGMSRAVGEKNTFWTSDVWVHNPQAAAIQVTFTPWLGGAAPFTRSVGPKGILQISDIVGAGGFGLEKGSGVVEVRSDSPFFVESRTYNSDPNNPAAGTYSATVRAFSEDLLVRGPGKAAVNAAEVSDAFRTNVTLFSPNGGTLALQLLDQQGTEISRTTANLGAKASWQQSLGGWFSSASNSVGALSLPAGFKGTVVVDVPANVLFQGYVSRVDNGTGDGMAPAFTAIQSCTPAAITSFAANPSNPTPGVAVTLSLASSGCVSAKVTPGDLAIPCNGSIIVYPTQTTEYTATATGACTPAATAKVSVNVGCPNIQVTADAQGATSFCAGGSVTIIANATNCASCEYTWYRNGQPYTSGRTMEASADGSYTVTAKDSAGCMKTSSPIAVGTYDTPTATVSGSTTLCTGGTATVTAFFSGTPPFSGQWSDGTPFQTSASTLNRTVSPSSTTTYSISSFEDAYCTGAATRSAIVTVSTGGVATITVPGSVCASSTGNTASVPAVSGGTYAWTLAGGTITAGQGTPAITWSAGSGSTVSISVTVTPSAACPNTGDAMVTVNPRPAISSFTSGAAGVPPGGGTTLTFAYTDGTAWAVSTSLGNTISPSSGTSMSGGSANYTRDNAFGDDIVTLTITGPCGTATQTLLIKDCNAPSATITAPSSVCHDSTGNAASVPNAGIGASYAWGITNGTITGGAGTNAITFSAGPTGPVQLTVTVTAAAGCSTAGNASVTVTPAPSISSFTATPSTISFGNTSTLSFTISNATSWSLSSSLGNSFSPISGSGNGTFTSTYSADNNTGTDTVTLTVVGACGTTTQTVQIIVN